MRLIFFFSPFSLILNHIFLREDFISFHFSFSSLHPPMSALTLTVEDYFSLDASKMGGLATENISNFPSSHSNLLSPSTLAPVHLTLRPLRTTGHYTVGSESYSSSAPELPISARLQESDYQKTLRPRVLPDAPTAKDVQQDTSAAAAAAAASQRPLLRQLKLSLKLAGLLRLFSATTFSPKSVRFASTLENVKMFDGRDSPAAVSNRNTPIGSPLHSHINFGDYFSHHGSFNDIFSDEFSEDDDEEDSDDNVFSVDNSDWKYQVKSLDFVPSNNIYDKKDSPLYLQKCNVLKDGKLLVLVVMCKNLAFEKHVAAKVTFNNWGSHMMITNFKYVKSFAMTGFDQFEGTIPLSHLSPFVKILFCINYTVDNGSYWDNNGFKNYNISLEKQTASKYTLDSFTYRMPKFSFAASSSPVSKKSDTFSDTSSASKNVSKSQNTNLDEVVTQLILKKLEKPKLHHSLSEPCLRPPKYSQSFRAKQEKLETQGNTAEVNDKSPERKFEDAIFNSSTYAALLQRYCFSGASASSGNLYPVSDGTSSPVSSLGNSFSTTSHDFHSAGDSIYT